ncbi:MAG: hypothetical protein FWF87_08810 [Synergistaceae bacterium]|nr:hypothetical protein [Synergistaceae bacterium]
MKLSVKPQYIDEIRNEIIVICCVVMDYGSGAVVKAGAVTKAGGYKPPPRLWLFRDITNGYISGINRIKAASHIR